MVVLHAAAIAVKPGGRGLQPGWGDDGETVEGVAEGLTDEFQPVKDTDGREDMRGVRALTDAPFKEATLARPSEEGVEQQKFGLAGDEPGAELAQHGMVEARVA
jgi:hypothetical protein